MPSTQSGTRKKIAQGLDAEEKLKVDGSAGKGEGGGGSKNNSCSVLSFILFIDLLYSIVGNYFQKCYALFPAFIPSGIRFRPFAVFFTEPPTLLHVAV